MEHQRRKKKIKASKAVIPFRYHRKKHTNFAHRRLLEFVKNGILIQRPNNYRTE